MVKIIVDFQPIGKRISILKGETILEAAQSSGVGLASVCGGVGTCEECKIRLMNGNLTPPTQIEETSLGDVSLQLGWRLACQAIPLTDVKILIPSESMTTIQRVQLDGEEKIPLLDPVTGTQSGYGLAIDVGTTKVAVYLVDLLNGVTVAKDGFMNPQIAYGEDVISRLAYAERVIDGAGILQKALFQSINLLLPILCKRGKIPQDQILDVVLVGNTVMHHLAAGLPTKQLGYAPFLPSTYEPVTRSSESLGLHLPGTSRVYFPPVIAGYVGSDHLAMLIALDKNLNNIPINNKDGEHTFSLKTWENFNQKNYKSLAIDIGTNTEISLIAEKIITCCSCASGPAFEGAHIQEGMRASPGAIERVSWRDGKLLWQTVGDQPPIGICGSGILDVVASLLRGHVIKSTGQMKEKNVYTVVPLAETSLGRDIVITRKDIHEIQLAKSAIRSGIDILLKHTGLRFEDLDEFIIAGAFGSYLDPKSAVSIGMFPPIPADNIHQVGNAAGMGAKRLLLSQKTRKNAEYLAKQIRYLELATHKEFQQVYLKNLGFHQSQDK